MGLAGAARPGTARDNREQPRQIGRLGRPGRRLSSRKPARAAGRAPKTARAHQQAGSSARKKLSGGVADRGGGRDRRHPRSRAGAPTERAKPRGLGALPRRAERPQARRRNGEPVASRRVLESPAQLSAAPEGAEPRGRANAPRGKGPACAARGGELRGTRAPETLRARRRASSRVSKGSRSSVMPVSSKDPRPHTPMRPTGRRVRPLQPAARRDRTRLVRHFPNLRFRFDLAT